MKKILFAFLILTFAVGFAFPQEKETPLIYQIQEIHQNSDFNERAIKEFKNHYEWRSDRPQILKMFRPVKGQYKVISFVATHYGLGFTEEYDLFHDLLLVKVDDKNEILDALHYRLEWAEPPLHLMIFRSTKKGLKLKKSLEVSELDFQPFESGLEDRYPRGLLDNLYNLQEVF